MRLPYSKLAPSWICFHIGPFAAAPSAPAAARLATLRAASFISKATSKVFSSNDACSEKGRRISGVGACNHCTQVL